MPVLGNTSSATSIACLIAENGSLMVLDSATKQYGVGILQDQRDETRLQSGMNCSVTKLTLLRGNRVLSHNGFSVTSGNDIKVIVS